MKGIRSELRLILPALVVLSCGSQEIEPKPHFGKASPTSLRSLASMSVAQAQAAPGAVISRDDPGVLHIQWFDNKAASNVVEFDTQGKVLKASLVPDPDCPVPFQEAEDAARFSGFTDLPQAEIDSSMYTWWPSDGSLIFAMLHQGNLLIFVYRSPDSLERQRTAEAE